MVKVEMERNTSATDAVERSWALPELAVLGDVPLDIEIVLGLSMMRVKDISLWNPGSLLTLNKPAGEPLDIYVSGELFGSGEIEASYDNVGFRFTSVVA